MNFFFVRSMTGGRDEGPKELRVWGFVFVLIVLSSAGGIYGALEPDNEAAGQKRPLPGNGVASPSQPLTAGTTDYNGDGDGGSDNSYGGGDGDVSSNRIGPGSPPCSKGDILVFQGATTPLPNGIPTYTVEIQNTCMEGNCTISNIHLSCGWFSSARLINPAIFRRIAYDDCLVNDGRPLNPGEVISFQYADSFEYPMSVSSVSC